MIQMISRLFNFRIRIVESRLLKNYSDCYCLMAIKGSCATACFAVAVFYAKRIDLYLYDISLQYDITPVFKMLQQSRPVAQEPLKK